MRPVRLRRSGRVVEKGLLGSVPILFMMAILPATFIPESMRELRNLFVRNRHVLDDSVAIGFWGSSLARFRCGLRFSACFLDGLCHAEILQGSKAKERP